MVVCPQCGLPHHRACWQQLGHCQQADKHGTEEQWSRKKALRATETEPETKTSENFTGKICPRCHTRNKEFAEFCAHCFSPLQSDDWHSIPPTPPVVEFTPFQSPGATGEIYTDTERLGTTTARELASTVGQNAAYYIPRFRRISSKRSGGWNWAAFILGPFWLLFRKQYVLGVLLLILKSAYSLLVNYWRLPTLMADTTEEYNQAMSTILASKLTVPVLVFTFFVLLIHLFLGLYANSLYNRHCEKVIHRAKEETPDLSPAELSLVGGTSMVAAMLGYFIPNLLLNLLTMMLIM